MYDPNLAEAYSAMGLSYFLWGKFEESSAACRKAMELDPEDFVVYWTLGANPLFQGRAGSCRELFRTLTRLKPDFYAGSVTLPDLRGTRAGRGGGQGARTVLEIMPMQLLRNPDDARGRLSTRAPFRGWASANRPWLKY